MAASLQQMPSEVMSMEKGKKNIFPTQRFISIFYCQTCESKCQSGEYSKELFKTNDELSK